MVNGSQWNLRRGERITELDEGRIEQFGSLITEFRENPGVALYRYVEHSSYAYYMALPTDDSSWAGEEFQCESLTKDSIQLHLANRSVDGANRLIILQVTPQDDANDSCQELEERSAIIMSAQ